MFHEWTVQLSSLYGECHIRSFFYDGGCHGVRTPVPASVNVRDNVVYVDVLDVLITQNHDRHSPLCTSREINSKTIPGILRHFDLHGLCFPVRIFCAGICNSRMKCEDAFRKWRNYVRERKRADSWIACAYEHGEQCGSVITFGWPTL